MNPLRSEDLVELEAYARIRPDYRRAVIEHKRLRRMPVGQSVTLLFEDRETLRFQVLEMLHVERIRDPQKVAEELAVYNELIPGEGELSATLFVEITEPSRIRAELDRLVGIDEHVSLELGDDGRMVPASFDPKQLEEDRISAVQYIRFQLDRSDAERFADMDFPAWIRIDHPNYARREPIPAALRASLIAGLRRDPDPLLDPRAAGALAPRDRTCFESDRVRAWSPGLSQGSHVIVETRGDESAVLDEHEALWRELQQAVRQLAREMVATHGACRIEAQLAGEGPTRFHLIAPGKKASQGPQSGW
jgi:hypothetical protein